MRLTVVRAAFAFAFAAAAFGVAACSDGAGQVSEALTADAGEGVDGGDGDAAFGDAATGAQDGSHDAAHDGGAESGSGDAAPDAHPPGWCEWGGAPGTCMTVTTCESMTDRSPYASSLCATGNECCIKTPSTADNPPIPAGYKLLTQSEVTADMTKWAVAILDDPMTYPMFATATKVFGALTVLARVEWHPPDFQNSVIHRGVTLYQPQ